MDPDGGHSPETVRDAVAAAMGVAVSDADMAAALGMLSPLDEPGYRRLVRMPDPPARARRAAVAAVAAASAAISGRRAHVCAVNAAAAQDEAASLGTAFASLGLSAACLSNDKSSIRHPGGDLRLCPRTEAFEADIVYGPLREFILDRLVLSLDENAVARPLDIMIVEDVGSFMADRRAVSLCGLAPDVGDLMTAVERAVAETLVDEVEPGSLVAVSEDGEWRWTDAGLDALAGTLSDPSARDRSSRVHGIAAAVLAAKAGYEAGRDYVTREGGILMLSYSGGPSRPMPAYLYRALESKEGLRVGRETARLAEMAPDDYLGLYRSVCGLLS